MNIFYLDPDPVRCAAYHGDKHVVKMILETAQLLCTAHHLAPNGAPSDRLYRLTHQNHPCAIWVRASKAHYKWAYQLFIALCHEYTRRYGKVHLTYQKLADILRHCPLDDDTPFIPPPLVMPPEFFGDDVVRSYRDYYKTAKADLMVYTNADVPDWA